MLRLIVNHMTESAQDRKIRVRKGGGLFASFMTSKEKDFFIENLAMLVGSGMTVTSSLETIREEIKSRRLKRWIDRVREDIENGSSVAKAMENNNFLKGHSLALIRIGEESGSLVDNLKIIAEEQHKARIFRSKINAALMYPVFVLFLSLAVGIGIAWFILPRLSLIFKSLYLELPLITKILMSIGEFLGKYGAIVVPGAIILLSVILIVVLTYGPIKHFFHRLLFLIPGIRDLIREVELARFGYLLGVLLRAALPIEKALESLADSTNLKPYKLFYKFLQFSVEDGNSFQKSFLLYPKTKKLIPLPIQQIIAAAEKSGNLSESLLKIGTLYQEKTENATKNLANILEPILLVVVWLGVLSVALAVILPIYSLIGGIQH